MREIKFRVWNKCENQYDYDFLIYKGKPCIVNGEIDLVGYTCWGELEQYTGLKDENGVEIYEGDIVEITYDGELTIIGSVVFTASSFKVETDSDFWDLDMYIDLKVVGNIHEVT